MKLLRTLKSLFGMKGPSERERDKAQFNKEIELDTALRRRVNARIASVEAELPYIRKNEQRGQNL